MPAERGIHSWRFVRKFISEDILFVIQAMPAQARLLFLPLNGKTISSRLRIRSAQALSGVQGRRHGASLAALVASGSPIELIDGLIACGAREAHREVNNNAQTMATRGAGGAAQERPGAHKIICSFPAPGRQLGVRRELYRGSKIELELVPQNLAERTRLTLGINAFFTLTYGTDSPDRKRAKRSTAGTTCWSITPSTATWRWSKAEGDRWGNPDLPHVGA